MSEAHKPARPGRDQHRRPTGKIVSFLPPRGDREAKKDRSPGVKSVDYWRRSGGGTSAAVRRAEPAAVGPTQPVRVGSVKRIKDLPESQCDKISDIFLSK